MAALLLRRFRFCIWWAHTGQLFDAVVIAGPLEVAVFSAQRVGDCSGSGCHVGTSNTRRMTAFRKTLNLRHSEPIMSHIAQGIVKTNKEPV